MRRAVIVVVSLALAAPLSLTGTTGTASATSQRQARAVSPPELSTRSHLADRRSLVVGDRFYEMGAEDGSYPATGFHTRGEMGGFWTPPVKLLDGLWFKAGDTWLTAKKYVNGWGYQRMDLGTHDGVHVTRTDVAPDGIRAGLIGLRLSSGKKRTLRLTVDAHSELMKVYPWGSTRPADQTTYNLQDSAAVDGKSLLFREQGTPPVANAEHHDYAALVGSKLTPSHTSLGPDHRGPQDPANVCTTTDGDTLTMPCDDTEFGKGTGGGLT